MLDQQFYHTAARVRLRVLRVAPGTATILHREHLLGGVGIPADICQEVLSVPTAVTRRVAGQLRMEKRSKQFFVTKKSGIVVAPAGLAERLEQCLSSSGFAVEHVNMLPWPSLATAWAGLVSRCDQLPEADAGIRTHFATRPRTQFKAASLRQAAKVIALAAEVFPSQQIHVIAKNKADCATLVKVLRESKAVALSTPADGNRYPASQSVVVSCPICFDTDFTRRSRLVILVGAEVVLGKAVQNSHILAHTLRSCILVGQKTISPSEAFHIERIFGPLLS